MRTLWARSPASDTMRSASSDAAWTTASWPTRRICSWRARSTRLSASRRALASSSSRSRTTHRACLISSGSCSRMDAISSSISSRFNSADDDSGMDLASLTMSSSCWIRDARSIRLPSLSIGPLGVESFHEALQDHRRHEPVDVAPQSGDLLDERRGQVRPVRARGHEERLHAAHPVVHLGHLQLVVEVRDCPEPLHDHIGVLLVHVVDEQPGERPDLDALHAARDLLQQADALLDAEHRRLGGVLQHAHDEPIEVAAGPFDDVQVTVGDGVECPRTEAGQAHQTSRYTSTRLSPYWRRLATPKCTGMTTLELRFGRVSATVHPGGRPFPPSTARTCSICCTGVSYGGSRNTSAAVCPDLARNAAASARRDVARSVNLALSRFAW